MKGRGEDTYVQVSWEQALKLIHEQHDRIRKANGPSAILPDLMAGVLLVCCIKAQTLLQRYMNWRAVIPGIAAIIQPERHR